MILELQMACAHVLEKFFGTGRLIAKFINFIHPMKTASELEA